MTNQEAINYLLDPLSLPHDMDIMDKLNWHEDAVNMAIEALKAQEVENSSDAQSVVICGACDNSESAELYLTNPPQIKCKRSGKLHFVTDRCDLPSVQPEIVRCGDCKHWICHDRRCGYWNHGVKPLEWCCHAERKENR